MAGWVSRAAESGNVAPIGRKTHLVLVLLVDGVEGVLDGDAAHVAGRHVEPQWEVQVDLLDRRRRQQFLERLLVLDAGGGRVEFPGAC